MTADNAGTDTITVTGQGAMATHRQTISGDQFQITTPAAGADVTLNTCTQLQVSWRVNGSPNGGQTVSFSATRGTIYADSGCTTTASSAVTDASGVATVYIRSTNAGPSTLTAYVTNGPTTSKNINFIATTAASIDLQVDNATIGPNDGSQSTQQQATITATIRDGNNNLVKGKVVRFSITEDVSGGSLTTATATTDLLGRASTTYVSSAATTATTGSDGTFEFNVVYPRQYGSWVTVRLTAATGVAGTESQHSVTFRLGTSSTDTDDINIEPPGRYSPFGVNNDCTSTL